MKSRGSGGSRIAVTTTQRRVRVAKARVRRLAEFVCQAEGRAIEHLAIQIVGRKRMTNLNRRHLGRSGTTDTISFDLGPAPGGAIHAQIVVCADVAEREGRRRGHPAWKELMLYVTHGLLHVLGYDDTTPTRAARMHRREDELLEQAGVGKVYHAG